jgi:hypothetical protein
MISPDTKSSGEIVIDALMRTHPAAMGTTSNSIAITNRRRRRWACSVKTWMHLARTRS